MKVIFLDFNGVLDTANKMDIIDMDNLFILGELVTIMEAKIVISSSVKNSYYYAGSYNKVMNYLIDVLINYGIEIYGITPWRETREEEIVEYLENHKEITDYLIIDDDYYFDSMKEHMLKLIPQCDGGNGLKDLKQVDLKKYIRRFNGGYND